MNLEGVIGFQADGNGSVLTPGWKGGYFQLPFPISLEAWTMIADQPGNATVSVKAASAMDFPLTGVNSIVGSPSPALDNSQISNGNVDTWYKDLAKDMIVAFFLDSVALITKLTFSLRYTRQT